MAIRANTTSPPLTMQIELFNLYFLIAINQQHVRQIMSKFLSSFFLLAIMFVSSCHKCQQCKQYCAYCISAGNNGVVHKICATNSVSYFTIDSIRNVYLTNGYDCNVLRDDKKVCDRPAKINDAVNYYVLEDYYCSPVE
jgi:hypothetical protein